MRYYILLFLITILPLSVRGTDQKKDASYYRELANQHMNLPEEVGYLITALEISEQTNDYDEQCDILKALTRNTFNRWVPDSIIYWGEKGVPLSYKHQEYSNMFDMLSLMCFYDLFSGKYETAIDKASEIFNLGKELNFTEGIIASHEAMGLIYRETLRPKQALQEYNDGIELIRSSNSRPTLELQFLTYVLEILLGQGKTEDAKPYIDAYVRIVQDFENNKYPNEVNIPIERCKWLAECYQADLYIREAKSDLATEHFKAASLYKENPDLFVRDYFNQISIAYHQKISHQYNTALQQVDEMIGNEPRVDIFRRKADILYDMGHYKECVKILNDVIERKDSIYDYELANQLNNLRSLHEVNKLQIEAQELEAKKKKLQLQIIFLTLGFVIVILISVVIILVRTSRTNKKLQKSEQALLIAKDRAEEANRMKTIFIQNMSHEIRTPLNAIVGFSSLLIEDPVEYKEFSGIIEKNSELLLKLVDDMLSISMMEATQQTVTNIQTTDIRESCRKALDSIGNKVQGSIDLVYNHDPSVNEIQTDPLRLHQILTNLLTNATKFTEEGEIVLSVEKNKTGNKIIFSVHDTGCGIPIEKQKVIFDRFVKLNDFSQGAGLGLYISKNLAKNLNGELYVDSTYTNGARFVLELPLS